MTPCNFFFTTFFTLRRSQVLVRQRNGNTAKRKGVVDKTLNRAGATPLFRLSAAQVNRGVAPARPEQLGAVFCPHAAEERRVC
jgi:hypothetical protein